MLETRKAAGELLNDAPPARPKRPRWPTLMGVMSIILGFPSVASLVICLAYSVVGRGPLKDIMQLHGLDLAANIALGMYSFGMSTLEIGGRNTDFPQRQFWDGVGSPRNETAKATSTARSLDSLRSLGMTAGSSSEIGGRHTDFPRRPFGG